MSKEMEARRKKAEALRYKKAMVNGLSFWQIQNSLEEMGGECDEVAYWTGSDFETLVDALDGDCDDAQRFQFDFAQLSADIERMYSDLYDISEPERFDDILVVSGIGKMPGYEILGYDIVEEDYFGIDAWMRGWAEEESVKRIKRLTKDEILEQLGQTLCIVFAYLGIQSRYQDLKASMDILRAQNKEYLDAVKAINEIYDQIDWTSYHPEWSKASRQIDSIIERMPQEAFL